MRLQSVGLLILLSSTSLFGASAFETELAQLREQRDKAIAAAADPINRRYQASLQQLLKRATQANDLDAAIKIKRELTGGEPQGEVADGVASNAPAIKKALPGRWNWIGTGGKVWCTFDDDTKMRMDNLVHDVKVAQSGVVTVTRPDKKQATLRFSADLETFSGTNFDGTPLKGTRRN